MIQTYLNQHADFSGVFNDRLSGAIYSCTHNGKVVNFQLTSRLILREKSKCHGQYHFHELAVVGAELGSGRYGVVNDISGRVSLVLQPTNQFGYKPKEHRSVVKTQYHFADYPEKFATREFNLLGLTGYVKQKNYYRDADGFISYIIARKITGKSLALVLNAELSLDERLRLSINILRALKEGVHDRGIVHRDIKPENIIVNAKLSAFFIDFGLSRQAGRSYNDGARCGTIDFISPDIAMVDRDGQPCLDEKSDTYSVGKLLSVIWGASNPVAENKFKDITDVIEFVLKGEKPVLFKNLVLPPEFSAAHRDSLAMIINGMMSVSRRKRMTLNVAITALHELRLSVLAAEMSRDEALDFYVAAAVVSELRNRLLVFQQSPEYSLAGMISIISSYAERLADRPSSIREFRMSLGIFSDNNALTKLELLKQCQSFSFTVEGFKNIFHELVLTVDAHIKNEKYFSRVKSNERLANLAHIRHLIMHEMDKLLFSRRDYSALEVLQEKLERKLQYFSSVISETIFISGWIRHRDLNEMIRCMDAFCDDIRPDYRNNLSRFKLDLVQVISSFAANYEASHHYSLFNEPAKMPGYAVRYAARLYAMIVQATDGDELSAAIRELKPRKQLFNYLNRQLHARLMHVIDDHRSWPAPVSISL